MSRVVAKRSIINLHIAVSLFMLTLVLVYVFATTIFITHLNESSRLVNMTGSLRARTYRLEVTVGVRAGTPNAGQLSGMVASQVHDVEQVLTELQGILSRPWSLHKVELLREVYQLDLVFRSELHPLLVQLLAERGDREPSLLLFHQQAGMFVARVDRLIAALQEHNEILAQRFQLLQIAFVACFLGALASIAFYVRRRMIEPILMLNEASQTMMEGDFSVRLSYAAKDEIGLLCTAFNHATSSLERLFTENKKTSHDLLLLTNISHEMLQLTSPGGVYRYICDRALDLLGVDMVWLGLADKEHSTVMQVAHAGDRADYLEGLVVTCDDQSTGLGPTGSAIRTRQPVLCRYDDERFGPWRAQAEQAGFRSSLALPLTAKEGVIGTLNLYSSSVTHFNQQLLEICNVYALQAAAMIENVRLIEYIVFALARAAEANDEDTGNHLLRVGEYCALLAKEAGLPPAYEEMIRFQAVLHDVGKIHVDPGILKKAGPLTDDQWGVMREHPRFGARIIGDHSVLEMAKDIALSHHERWDGSGYPFGLRGEEIPLAARLMNIADQYDALRSQRVYKPAFDHATVCRIMLEGDGRTMPEHFDPALLAIFRRSATQFGEIYDRLQG